MNGLTEIGSHFDHTELGVNPSEFWVPSPIELKETSDGHVVINVQVGADLHASEISGYAPHGPATTSAVLDRLHADGIAQYFQPLVDENGASYLIHPSPPDVYQNRAYYNALSSQEKAAYLGPLAGGMALAIGGVYQTAEKASARFKNTRVRKVVRGAIEIAGGAALAIFIAGCGGRGLENVTPSPMPPSPGNTPGLTPTSGETPMLSLSAAGEALQASLSQLNIGDNCVFDRQTLTDFQAIGGSELNVAEVARFTQVALEHNPPEGLTRFVCDYDKATDTFVFYFEDSQGQLFSPTRDGLQWLPMVLVDGQLELKTPPPSEAVSATLPPYPDYIPAQGGAIPDWLVPFAEVENASIKNSLSKQGINTNTVELETIYWYAVGANNVPEMRWGTVAWANREHTAVYWTRYTDGIQELTDRPDLRPTGEGARPWSWDTVATDRGKFIAIYQEGSELPQLLVVDPSKEDAGKGVPVIGQFDTKSETIIDASGQEVVLATATPEPTKEPTAVPTPTDAEYLAMGPFIDRDRYHDETIKIYGPDIQKKLNAFDFPGLTLFAGNTGLFTFVNVENATKDRPYDKLVYGFSTGGIDRIVIVPTCDIDGDGVDVNPISHIQLKPGKLQVFNFISPRAVDLDKLDKDAPCYPVFRNFEPVTPTELTDFFQGRGWKGDTSVRVLDLSKYAAIYMVGDPHDP